MTRFYADEAGRVYERATGLELGRVDSTRYGTEALHLPRDWTGKILRSPTMILDLAILSVIRSARPGEAFTLLDIEGG